MVFVKMKMLICAGYLVISYHTSVTIQLTWYWFSLTTVSLKLAASRNTAVGIGWLVGV